LVVEGSQARILLFDIETAPNLAFVWGKYEQNVLAYESEWYILCFAYRWLGSEETSVIALPDFKVDYKADASNDYKVVEKLHALFCEADVVIGHNSNSFDNRKTNARFLFHGFDPPTPYKEVDTCLVARKYFSFNSNKLGDLGETLGVGSKAETGGFGLWLGCLNGDKNSWEKMKSYNAQDVTLLEKVYLRLRPWINGHPNVAVLEGNLDCCPKCGADTMMKRGFGHNRVTTFQRYQCTTCGGWSSSRIAEKIDKPLLIN